MGRKRQEGQDTEATADGITDRLGIIRIQGWEDGVPVERSLDEFDRWTMQSADSVQFSLGSGKSIALKQLPHSNCFGAYLWDSAIILSRWFELAVPRHRLLGAKCIELGAGVGLVGISVACMGAHVTLTDIGTMVPLLQENVEANAGSSAAVCKLDWGTHLLRSQKHDAASARLG